MCIDWDKGKDLIQEKIEGFQTAKTLMVVEKERGVVRENRLVSPRAAKQELYPLITLRDVVEGEKLNLFIPTKKRWKQRGMRTQERQKTMG